MPDQSNTPAIARIADTFIVVVRFCRFALLRVPSTFTAAIMPIIDTDTSLAVQGASETNSAR